MLNLKYFIVINLIPLLLSGAVLPETISREDFLDQLLKYHPISRKEQLGMDILKEGQNALTSTKDWRVNSSAFYIHDEPSFAVAGPERTDAVQIGGSVEKLSWKTGGVLNASFTSTRTDLKINPMYGIPDSYYENKIGVSYILPLKKNKGGVLNRLAYDLRKYDINISDIIAGENIEEFLTVYAEKYLDWVYYVEQKDILEKRLALSEELLKNTTEKREANLVDEVDVIRSNDAVINTKQALLLIETRLKSLRNELAEITNDERYQSSVPSFDLFEFDHLVPLFEAMSYLKDSARVLRNISLRIDQVEHSKIGLREMTKSDLMLIASLDLKNADDGIGNSLVMDKPGIKFGLQYNFPVGHKEAKSNLAIAELRIEQLKKQYEEISLSLTSSLASLHSTLVELKSVLELNIIQIETAQRKTEEELKLYNQGRGQMTFVIQSRDNEQAARLNYVSNALTYQKILVRYNSLLDRIYR